jgi:hypothetical protein
VSTPRRAGGPDPSSPAGLLRVTLERRGGCGVVFLEGHLHETTLRLVEAACREVRAAGLRLVLDLDGLRWVDHASADALRSIAAGGARLRNAHRYVGALLGADPGSSPVGTP